VARSTGLTRVGVVRGLLGVTGEAERAIGSQHRDRRRVVAGITRHVGIPPDLVRGFEMLAGVTIAAGAVGSVMIAVAIGAGGGLRASGAGTRCRVARAAFERRMRGVIEGGLLAARSVIFDGDLDRNVLRTRQLDGRMTACASGLIGG